MNIFIFSFSEDIGKPHRGLLGKIIFSIHLRCWDLWVQQEMVQTIISIEKFCGLVLGIKALFELVELFTHIISTLACRQIPLS